MKVLEDEDPPLVAASNRTGESDDAKESERVELPLLLRKFVAEDIAGRASGDATQGTDVRRALVLRMDNCSVSRDAIAGLADFLVQINSNLVRLSLSNNTVGPQGLVLLGRALITNNSLQFLELDSCDLVGSPYRPQLDGLLALSKGIQSTRSNLRFLKYACTLLLNICARYFLADAPANAISNSACLQVASTANNNLQPEGCRIVLGALSVHPTITALDISGNMLSLFNDKQGYLALSYLLQFARRLCWLSISDNPLPRHALPVMREALVASTSLTTLYADNCGIPSDHIRLQLAQLELQLAVNSSRGSGSSRELR